MDIAIYMGEPATKDDDTVREAVIMERTECGEEAERQTTTGTDRQTGKQRYRQSDGRAAE